MYQLSYHKDKSIYYAKAHERVDMLKLIEVVKFIISHASEREKLFIITDYRDSKINKINIDHIESLCTFIKEELIPNYDNITWTSLSLDYIPTTIGIIIKENLLEEDIEYEPFTTEKKVCEWMNIRDLKDEDFELLLDTQHHKN